MATVRMLSTVAGPVGPLREGKFYDLPGAVAASLVTDGVAEWVGVEPERAVKKAPETRRAKRQEPEPTPEATDG